MDTRLKTLTVLSLVMLAAGCGSNPWQSPAWLGSGSVGRVDDL